MTTYKHSVGAGYCRQIGIKEIADMDTDAWGTESATIVVYDSLALMSNLECLNLQMRELQSCFNGHAARTESYVPHYLSTRQIECLQSEQSERHLGNHLFATIEQRELAIGYAESLLATRIAYQNNAVGIIAGALGGFVVR